MGFTKLGRAEVEGCADVAHYKSTTTSMQVIISKVPSPLISAQIIIPTKAESSKGEPHCLEHLAFRGSRLYPVAGMRLVWGCLRSLSAYTFYLLVQGIWMH